MNFDARLLLVALSLCLASACGAEEDTAEPTTEATDRLPEGNVS